jgi:DNA primase
LLPEKSDPDSLLMEKGPQQWQILLEKSVDYLSFLVDYFSKSINTQSAAGKNELILMIGKRIREWDHPLMIHESLRKLARITNTPESLVGAPEEHSPQLYIKRVASVTFTEIDPDRILEADLLRWLLLMGQTLPQLFVLAAANLSWQHFRVSAARNLFEKIIAAARLEKPFDLLSLAIDLESPDHQLFMAEVLQKKINRDRALACFTETVQKILERHWMHQREEIKIKIYSGSCSEAEVLELARQFDELKKIRPQVIT